MPPRKGTAKIAPKPTKKVQQVMEVEDDPEDIDESEEDEDDSEDGDTNEDDEDSDSSSAGFEEQSSDSSDEEVDEGADARLISAEESQREWSVGKHRSKMLDNEKLRGVLQQQQYMHTDDLSSDDEEAGNNNTIGRVPLHWYDAFDHIGYDVAGSKLLKRKGKDRIDLALQQRDNPNAAKLIYDMYNDREVQLTERELEIIRRVQSGAFAHPEFEAEPDYVDYVSGVIEEMPLSQAPARKGAFLPSKWEMKRVMTIVKAMREGRYQTIAEREELKRNGNNQKTSTTTGPYLLWTDTDEDNALNDRRQRMHLPAPRMPLPGHNESYNPPAEYLFNPEEQEKYDSLDPEEKNKVVEPKQFSCLRHVPAYSRFVTERFERCLDLYLCPRKLKQRLDIDPEALVPRLPHPRELKPFPNAMALQYLGHVGAVRCLSISQDGQYMLSGGEDGTVRLWEVDTALCRYTWQLGRGAILSLQWNPVEVLGVIAVGTKDGYLVLLTTGLGDEESIGSAEALLEVILQVAKEAGRTSNGDKGKQNKDSNKAAADKNDDSESDNDNDEPQQQQQSKKTREFEGNWIQRTDHNELKVGPRAELRVTIDNQPVTKVNWHRKGEYLLVVASNAGRRSVSVHHISKAKSQFPFGKAPGLVQTALFHPSLPCLIVATQQHVKIFHLIEQKLVKKLLTGCKWVSSIDIHPSGDHLLIGSYDRRVVWFDLDLASTPYKTLKFHEKAVRSVQYHSKYPLFASAADDGNVHVFHCMVYADMSKNPLLVPLKVLRGHGVAEGELGVLSAVFHPRQPWLFSAGADGLINLYQDL